MTSPLENLDPIYCPCCEELLVVTHQDRYQDRIESVCDNDPSLKDGYQCLNTYCVCKPEHLNVVWIYDGEYFIRPPKRITYSESLALMKSKVTNKHNLFFALNSWNYHYELGVKEIEIRKKEFKIGKYTIVKTPKKLGSRYPIEREYQPSKWKFELTYLKENEDGETISLIPHYRMIKYLLRNFKESYKKNDNEECLNIINGTRFGYKDDRFFVKASSVLVKILHPFKVKNILKNC
jgi:hypothetical protein